jgi:hypothetical protein
MTLARTGYTPKHDVAQKFPLLELVSLQLRHFHHRSRRNVQPLDRRRTNSRNGFVEIRRLFRGIQPRWNKNGKEIFYVSSDSKMMARSGEVVVEK